MKVAQLQNTQPINNNQDVLSAETQQLQQIQVLKNPTQDEINYQNLQTLQAGQQAYTTQTDKKVQEDIDERSLSQKLCSLFCQIISATSIQIVFGVLLWVFQDQGEKNDYCNNDSLKKWAKAASIILFIQSGVLVLQFIDKIFIKSVFQTKGKFFKITLPIQILLAIGIFVTSIGLNINNSSDCDKLYKLALAFYIIDYIAMGIAFIIIIILIYSLFKALSTG